MMLEVKGLTGLYCYEALTGVIELTIWMAVP